MAVSVRLDPILEMSLSQVAKRQGISKSQFIVNALERALGHQEPFALFKEAQDQVAKRPESKQEKKAFNKGKHAYDTEQSRAELIAKLREKHGLSPH